MRLAIAVLAVLAACGAGPALPDAPIPEDDAAFADAHVDVCVPLQRACPDGDKCTLVAGTSSLERACVAPTGSLARGDLCTRTSPGHDDCTDGLFCTFIGATALTCAQMCRAADGCAIGQRCAVLDTQLDGICVGTCTPFGGACGAQGTCGTEWFDADTDAPIFACRPIGTVALGGTCTSDADCGADAMCRAPGTSTTDYQCQAMCDGAHPCAAGTCQSGLCE